MLCKLCRINDTLVRKSHIIPDFMYRDLFNEHHMLAYVEHDYKDWTNQGLRPSGVYEGNILCKTCDNNLIGSLESYASQVIYGGKSRDASNVVHQAFRTPDGVYFTQVENVDYSRFKLFLLSILWKSSISSREFFKEVQLGVHEARIKKMIMEHDPKEIDDYPVLFLNVASINEKLKNIIPQPRKLKHNGRTLYSFLIGGTILLYNVSKNNTPKLFTNSCISRDNKLNIVHLEKETANVFLAKLYGVKNLANL